MLYIILNIWSTCTFTPTLLSILIPILVLLALPLSIPGSIASASAYTTIYSMQTSSLGPTSAIYGISALYTLGMKPTFGA